MVNARPSLALCFATICLNFDLLFCCSISLTASLESPAHKIDQATDCQRPNDCLEWKCTVNGEIQQLQGLNDISTADHLYKNGNSFSEIAEYKGSIEPAALKTVSYSTDIALQAGEVYLWLQCFRVRVKGSIYHVKP